MKKGKLLHSALSHEIAKLGHTQTLVLGDAGLPIPPETRRIDLAVTQGVPALLSVLDAVLSELAVQKITLAEEIKTASPEMDRSIRSRFPGTQICYVPHEAFKALLPQAACVVRTGETTSYANVILESGVTFSVGPPAFGTAGSGRFLPDKQLPAASLPDSRGNPGRPGKKDPLPRRL